MWNIHTMEYYSAMEKNEIMPFTSTWMQLEILILSEVSQTEKDKHHMISRILNLIYGTNEPIYRKETNSWTWRTDLWLSRGRRVSGMDWENRLVAAQVEGEGLGGIRSLGLLDANYWFWNAFIMRSCYVALRTMSTYLYFNNKGWKKCIHVSVSWPPC